MDMEAYRKRYDKNANIQLYIGVIALLLAVVLCGVRIHHLYTTHNAQQPFNTTYALGVIEPPPASFYNDLALFGTIFWTFGYLLWIVADFLMYWLILSILAMPFGGGKMFDISPEDMERLRAERTES